MARLFWLFVVVLLFSPPAFADAVVSGWTVWEKPNDGVCLASRTYKDAADGNKSNTVAMSMAGKPDPTVFVIAFGYDGWNFAKGVTFDADLVADGQKVTNISWKGDEKVATGVFRDVQSVMTKISHAKIIGVHNSAGSADFETPNVGPALMAMLICLGQ